MSFMTFESTFTCELQSGDYSGFSAIMKEMNSQEKCLEKIEDAFKIVDKDGDGYISRCEDASMQVALGAAPEYALKYSTSWTLASGKKYCNMM